MGKYAFTGKLKIHQRKGNKFKDLFLENENFKQFNVNVLGLGDVNLPSKKIEALAAVFDLSGFTTFCSQIDPQLSVPDYLSRFLDWLFDEIQKQFVIRKQTKGRLLYANFPFLAKFMGDGVLFLWDTNNLNGIQICNIVLMLEKIQIEYKKKFYPKIKKIVTYAPNTLRCGIARGTVFSVGDGNDYVGPCINIASRLQKMCGLTFCVSRKGFDFEKDMSATRASSFEIKSLKLRDTGDYELVWVLKEEFKRLKPDKKSLFLEP